MKPACLTLIKTTGGEESKMANMMKERIGNLLSALNKGIYEKENEIALSLLAAVAGESIILLGPPGVAKSMVARRLSDAFANAKSFEYLMSRFSTPDEIFGPVSISKLKSSDDYERVTDGYLPTADVVFLDEIWKAGPAIQNTLLTVINEKIFRNGNKVERLPLKLLVAASNELPAQGEGLEALWDRFIIRLESRSIKKDADFDKMLRDENDVAEDVAGDLKITNEEYSKWTQQIKSITISDHVLDVIHKIRRSLSSVSIEGTDERRTVYVSDRRWKNIAHLLRTSAFLQDRKEVGVEDLLPVYSCLWQEPEERDGIRQSVIRCMFSPFAIRLEDMKRSLAEEIKSARAARAAGRISSRQMELDADKKLYNNFYYRLTDYKDGPCYVFAHDFQRLPGMGKEQADGVLYKDSRHPRITIIRSYDGSDSAPLGSTPVMLMRDPKHIYLDGVRFTIETDESTKDQSLNLDFADSGRDYEKEIDTLADDLRTMKANIDGNLFVAEEDQKLVDDYLKELYKQIAFTRQDIGKLYD